MPLFDYEGAILSHTRWKRRIHASMSAGGALDPVEAARADACQLGRWIAGAGAPVSRWPEYQALARDHGRFHLAAAEVVRAINAGRHEEAVRLLGFGSEYTEASEAVVRGITALRLRGGQL